MELDSVAAEAKPAEPTDPAAPVESADPAEPADSREPTEQPQSLMESTGEKFANSQSEPTLNASTRRSPTRSASGAWMPPPGAFNEQDAPCICDGPGPGRYTPNANLTLPRSVSSSFGTEDRLKHLGRQRDSSQALDGPVVTSWGPQIGLSPGPIYLPSYSVTELQSRSSTFPGESRAKSSAVASVSRAKTPGPGAYNPAVQHAVLSTKPRVARQTHFASDSRLKYLGEQLEGVTILRITSPGPAYAPNHGFVLKSYGSVSFGKPQAKLQRAMSFADQAPGPGAYTPAVQAAVLSTKPTQHAPSFGKEQRFSTPGQAGGDGLSARRPITPGPKYLPNYAAVRPNSKGVKIGTAKRFGGCCGAP